ncbi:N-acetylmuramoyl-L-alanine amidase [Schaalia sp.]|uniref:N-acetylmuramoyl-L-alanine amidase n=1 Tax=Schaalia sp. TaxID=2691890 RepID=UPI003D0E3E25
MVDYPTPNMHVGRLGRPRLVVLHSTETPTNTARAVAKNFQDPAARASAHWVVGTDGVFTCVGESDTAWAAPGANHDGIQIEQAGYAYRTDWTSADGAQVVAQTARLVAQICTRWGIPVRHLTDAELANGHPGIVTHAQISRVYRQSDHTDPGPTYPMATLLAQASGAPATSTSSATTTREDTPMYLIRTTTPWNTYAYALVCLSGLGGARAIEQSEADYYYPVLGVRPVGWATWNGLVERAWAAHAAAVKAIGGAVDVSISDEVDKIIRTIKEIGAPAPTQEKTA